ncbi:MAG: PKD domain-containing protein [Anaerolineae bacterium]
MKTKTTRTSSVLIVVSLLMLFLFATSVHAAAPVINTAGITATVQNNLVVIFVPYADESGDTQTSLIDWGDGTIQPGLIVNGAVNGAHVYGATGTYTVSVQIRDNTNLSAGSTLNVTVTTLGSVTNTPAAAQCAEYNGVATAPVRAGVPDAIRASVYCRVLAQDSFPYVGPGALPAGNGTVGNPVVINQGVVQAVDVFTPNHLASLSGVAICLRGAGSIVLLSGIPRTPEWLPSYSLDSMPGFTCAGIPRFGTVALVQQGGTTISSSDSSGGSSSSPFVLPTPQGYTAGLRLSLDPQCSPATRGVVFLRAQPSAQSAQVTVLGDNTPVVIRGMVGTFYLVETGIWTGYVRADLISFQCGAGSDAGSGAVG